MVKSNSYGGIGKAASGAKDPRRVEVLAGCSKLLYTPMGLIRNEIAGL